MYPSLISFNSQDKFTGVDWTRQCPVESIEVVLSDFTNRACLRTKHHGPDSRSIGVAMDVKRGTFSVDETLINCFTHLGVVGIPFSLCVVDDASIFKHKNIHACKTDVYKCEVYKLSMDIAWYTIRTIIERYRELLWIKNLYSKTAKHQISIGYCLLGEAELRPMFEELDTTLKDCDVIELVSACKKEDVANNCNAYELFDEFMFGHFRCKPDLIRPLTYEEVMKVPLQCLIARTALLTIAAAAKTKREGCLLNKSNKKRDRRNRKKELRKVSAMKDEKGKDEGVNFSDEVSAGALKLKLLDPVKRAVEIQRILENHDDECMMCMEKYQLVDNFRGKCGESKEEESREKNRSEWSCDHKVCGKCFEELKKGDVSGCIVCSI